MASITQFIVGVFCFKFPPPSATCPHAVRLLCCFVLVLYDLLRSCFDWNTWAIWLKIYTKIRNDEVEPISIGRIKLNEQFSAAQCFPLKLSKSFQKIGLLYYKCIVVIQLWWVIQTPFLLDNKSLFIILYRKLQNQLSVLNNGGCNPKHNY